LFNRHNDHNCESVITIVTMLDYDHNCRDDHITGGRAKIILLWQIVLEVKMEMMDSEIPYIITLKSLTLQKGDQT